MTTTHWFDAVAGYRASFEKDLVTLLRIESVRDDAQATATQPLGPGPAEALCAFLAMAERDGFRTVNHDNLVGYIEVGPRTAPDYIAILSHADVVPAGDGWESAPFDPVVTDETIMARGVSDDKGPGMAAYYALKMLVDAKVPLKHRIRLVIGTDEENGWACMTRYFANEPAPLCGFSPDAEFPIINGEKGNVQFLVTSPATQGTAYQLMDFTAGERMNMVPGKATATLAGVTDDLTPALAAYCEHYHVTGEVTQQAGQATVTVFGKQVHGAMPATGKNAGMYLANFLQQYPFGGNAAQFLHFLGATAFRDTTGKCFGVTYIDDVMGPVSMNIGIQRFDAAGAFLNVNYRYPKGITPTELAAGMTAQLNGWEAVIAVGEHAQEPHYVSPKDPVVQTLLDIYARQTGLPAHDQVIGGGTYGRLMTRGVAFGALFPDSPDTMHQAGEMMRWCDLERAMAIYAEAMVALANLTD